MKSLILAIGRYLCLGYSGYFQSVNYSDLLEYAEINSRKKASVGYRLLDSFCLKEFQGTAAREREVQQSFRKSFLKYKFHKHEAL